MTETVLFAEQTVSGFAYANTYGCFAKQISPAPFIPEEGRSYIVNWDGEQYTRTAFRFTAPDGGSCVGVGNTILTGIDSGEPFLVGYDETKGIFGFFSTETTSTHTVSVLIQEHNGIILKNRDGKDVAYEGVTAIQIPGIDGNKKSFINANVVETEVQLDFSKGDMEVVPDTGNLFSKVSIPTPANLAPENIPKGITIAGVKGDLTVGGEVNLNDKPIRFYDPYGNVIYGYSRAELQEMTALPAGPALSGLTFERWTHTLDELKSVMYFADVGPMYKYGSNPATVLIIETEFASQEISIRCSLNSCTGTIYWGDGSSSKLAATTQHSYASAGVYIIAIVVTAGLADLGIQSSSYNYNVMNNSIASFTTGDGYMNGTTDHHLRSVLIGSYMYFSMYAVRINYLTLNNRLKFVSEYRAKDGTVRIKKFANCPALQTIAGNQAQNAPSSYAFWCCDSLKKLSVTSTISEKAFNGCGSLEEVIYGSGKINAPMMNKQWAMLMTTETPPTIGAASPQWGKKPIYVPDSAVDAYKTASGWSNAAAYIIPASQYPDK